MRVSEYIFNQIKTGNLDTKTGKSLLEEVIPDDIAIVGMSCEYTNVKGIFDFYNMNKYGMRGFKEFPKQRVQYIPKDHSYLLKGAEHLKITPEEFLERLCKEKGAYLDNIDAFDPEFFGISKEEAKYIDPTHRLVMEHSYLALEDAGIKLDDIKDSKTAIYVGKDKSITANYRSEIEEDSNYVNSGTWEGILASRLNYILNLSGGSFVIDTACSSSLVATHLAVKTLRDKEIDTAIVGGIALGLFPRQGSTIDQYGDVETSRSFLKVFDAQSEGTIFGEGVGIVVLKRLKDAIANNDNIYSVIRGSMINSDGKSNGLTAPNPHAQKDLLLDIYERNHISPETVEYIDAHGTGTKLGDPIEVRGLTDAYKKYSDKKGFCALTSLKENIGHTVGAAGVGGLIKMSLALRNKEIFPVESFEAPNEYIKFVDSPFYIPTKAMKWKKGKYPRRGGVSSFGFSGTNAHVVLEEYENQQEQETINKVYPLVFSAQSLEQLSRILRKYIHQTEYIRNYSLKDISYTLTNKRNHFKTRIGFEARNMTEFMDKVKKAILVIENGESYEGIFLSEESSISSDLKKIMSHRLKTEYDQFALTELVKFYVDGHDTAFENFLYNNPKAQSLPAYEFKQEALWANVRKHNIYQNVGSSLPMKLTLIKQQMLKTSKSDVYAVNISPEDWFVNDHRIEGKRTFSGTTYTELAAELASLYFDKTAYTLEKLYFKNLIQLEDNKKTFYIHVNKNSSRNLDIEVFSYENDQMDKYITFATFTLKPIEAQQSEIIQVHEEFEPYLITANFQSEENDFFKGRWDFGKQNFRFINKSKTEILMALSLKEEFLGDLKDFHLHPSILDGILGGMVYERAQSYKKHYLPLSYGKFIFTGNTFTQTMYSKTEFLYDIDEDQDVISANISIFNSDGELVAYLDKYSMKSFANAYFKPCLHKVGWEKSSVKLTVESNKFMKEQKVLVVTNKKTAVNEELDVDYVNYKEIKDMNVVDKYAYVIYAPWFVEQMPASQDLERESLYYFEFAKTVNKLVQKNGKVLIVANNAFVLDDSSQKVNPLNYSLLSSGRILGLENTGFTTQMINISKFDLQIIMNIAKTDSLDGKKVIYENNTLYEEALVEAKDIDNKTITLADEDCVIVTGGYGGVGLEYIEKLLEINEKVHIAILGRTDMLATLASKEKLASAEEKKLEKINKLKNKGKNIEFYKCDISCEVDVKTVINNLVRNHNIKGVVHLAGVPEEGMLFAKSQEEFIKITSPKVTGTALLRKYLKDESIEFFINSSSMTTIIGSAGQFSYTFANAFLEGYALMDEKMKTVLWPGWNEVGMALKYGDMEVADEHLLMKSISSAVGREYIGLSLEKDIRKVIVGEFNSAKASDYLQTYMKLPQSLLKDNEGVDGAISEEQEQVQIKEYDQLEIIGVEGQDEIEKFITVVFASILDCDVIDVNKSFTELGGDSLKAFAIYSPIAEHFEIDIEVADVFIYPTVMQLSEYVKELLEEENE